MPPASDFFVPVLETDALGNKIATAACLRSGPSPMPDTAPDLQRACSDLLPQPRIEEFQRRRPDPIPPRACARAREAQSDAPRDAKGRFANGHSGNPKGRPRGIR